MIAMILRETALLERSDLSSVSAVRMGSAPISEGLMEAARRAFPHAVITNGYGTTEAGPIVFSAHPDGRPTPDLSVGVAHPHVELRLVAGRWRGGRGRAADALSGSDDRVPQPARRDGEGADHGRLLHHR